jgi:hypothetical protein
MTGELESVLKEVVIAYSKYCPNNYLEWLRKTIKYVVLLTDLINNIKTQQDASIETYQVQQSGWLRFELNTY